MVFDFTAGGTKGGFIKSYRALAERPLWLCCSERKARSTVEIAERLGFVITERRRAWTTGSQQENAYRINWDGITAILKQSTPDGTTRHGPGTTSQPHGTTSHPHGTTCRHIEEEKLSGSPSEETPGTGPGTEPNPTEKDSEQEGRPRTAALQGNNSLTETLLAQSPILRAAREQRITPLPASVPMLHGVYHAVELCQLQEPSRLIQWHREQLLTSRPPMSDTVADLLLTIATAMYATAMPSKDVLKNRVAVFADVIARRKFAKSLPHVPKARDYLDRAIKKLGPEWAGLSAAQWAALSVAPEWAARSVGSDPPRADRGTETAAPRTIISGKLTAEDEPRAPAEPTMVERLAEVARASGRELPTQER
jgi:hypothetical protein